MRSAGPKFKFLELVKTGEVQKVVEYPAGALSFSSECDSCYREAHPAYEQYKVVVDGSDFVICWECFMSTGLDA